MKTTVIAAIVIVIIIIVAGGAFLALNSGKNTTSTVTSSSTISTSTSSSSATTSSSSSSQSSGSANTAAVQAADNAHVAAIQSRNVPTVLGAYASNAVVVWSGNTGGLGGTYPGLGNIRLLYAGALSTAQQMTLAISNYAANVINSSSVNSTYDLTMNGSSSVLGAFHGHITAEVNWVYNGTGWAIQAENWNYVTFVTSVAGGATTFPQWHTPSRESPDAFKNFVFHIGGGAYAFVIFAYFAVMGVLLIAFLFRRMRFSSPQSATKAQ